MAPRSRSNSLGSRPPSTGVSHNRTFTKHQTIGSRLLGTANGEIPVLVGVVSLITTAATGGAAVTAAIVRVILYTWATSNGDLSSFPRDLVERERSKLRFEPGCAHVAICGPAESGKSSILNALRGIQNSDSEAARTGTTETTIESTKYPGHASFGSLMLHDCPGAGTLRVPTDGYYKTQKLYLFDMVLIVQGEQFGEVCKTIRCDMCIRTLRQLTII